MVRAAAKGKVGLVKAVRSAAEAGEWRAAEWLLACCDPHNYHWPINKRNLRDRNRADERGRRRLSIEAPELVALGRILGMAERRVMMEREDAIRDRIADDPPASAPAG